MPFGCGCLHQHGAGRQGREQPHVSAATSPGREHSEHREAQQEALQYARSKLRKVGVDGFACGGWG